MFRRYIADPIPSSVRSLAPASAAPIAFHQGALIAFDAPDSVLRAILNHTLSGSTARAWLTNLQTRNGRDSAIAVRLSRGDGAYVPMDSASFPPDLIDVFRSAHTRVRDAGRAGLEAYAFAAAGDWGRLESVVSYDRSTGRVRVQQYSVRAPRD
jgi:hypothetical protein